MADSPRWDRGTLDATRPETPTALVESTTPARFQELSELGRGGMGRVFEAHDPKLNRVVAVKQALTNDAGVLERFDREVMIAARLQHPNLITLLDAGHDERGRPYYAMNKIDGTSLDRMIEAAPDLRGRLALVANVAAVVEGAAYAHARNVIHRDIKPSNILVGSYGETLLIDWGIARVLDETPEPVVTSEAGEGLTRMGTAMGTPGFMPPEQARGEAASRASDVYALGVTLYNVLTGERPFAKLSETESIEAAAAERGLDLARIPSDVPRDLVTIVRKATAGRPADRYTDAVGLAHDLRAFLGGQLVPAHEYKVRERIARFVARYRIAVTFGSLALIAIAIVSIISLSRVLAARRTAETAQANAETRLGELIANLAMSSPDVALGMLGSLPLESPAWANAHDTVTTALLAGGGRGLSLGTSFALPRAHPDGNAVVVLEAGFEWLRFFAPDLRGPSPRMPLGSRIEAVYWIEGGRALLGVTPDRKLVRIDRASGARTPLDTARATAVAIVETKARVVVLADHRLLQIDVRGGAPTELATDVIVAGRLATGLVYVTSAAVHVLPDRGPAIVVEPVTTDWIDVRPDGRRFAYLANDALVDRALSADGSTREHGRWIPEGQVETVMYCGDRLLGKIGRDMFSFPPGHPPWRTSVPVPDSPPVWQPSGMLYVNGERVAFTAGDKSIEVFETAAPLQRIDVVDNFILGTDRAGVMRSWPVDRLLAIHSLPDYATEVAAMSDDHMLVRAIGKEETLWRVPLDGSPPRLLENRGHDFVLDSPTFFCERDGYWFRIYAETAWFRGDSIVELGGPAPRDLGVTIRAGIACDLEKDLFTVLTPEGIEVRDRGTPATVRNRIAARGAKAAASHGGYVLIMSADNRFTLYSEAGTPLRSRSVPDTVPFAIAEGGTIASLESNRLVLWSATGTRTIDLGLDATARLDSVVPLADGFVIRGNTNTLISDNTLILIVRPDGTVARLGNAGTFADITATRVLTRSASGDVTITDIRTGSSIRLALRGFEIVRLTPSGERVVAVSFARGVMRVLRLDEAPVARAALHAYVLDQSNARVDRGAAFASFPSE